MAKKRNYENDEAYKNFRLEDYLPSMNRREPEAKISEPSKTQPRKRRHSFLRWMHRTYPQYRLRLQKQSDLTGRMYRRMKLEPTMPMKRMWRSLRLKRKYPLNGLLPDASAANNADSLWRSIAPRICKFPESQTASLCSSAVRCVTGWMR